MKFIRSAFDKIGNVFHELQPYALTIIVFTVSAIFSVMLWRDQGTTDFSKNLYALLAIGIDCGKFFFPIASMMAWKDGTGTGKVLSAIYCVLFLGCLIYSIVASMNFNLLEIQNQKANAYKNSQAYISQQAYEENKSKTIEQLEKDIAKFESDKNVEIKELEKARDQWNPDNYKSGKVWIQENRQAVQNKITATTDKWNTKINTEKEKLNNLRLEKSDIRENTTEKEFGNSILFPTLEAQKNFFFWMAILIELVGIFAGVEVTRRKGNIKFNLPIMPKRFNKTGITPAPAMAKIGFKTNTNEQAEKLRPKTMANTQIDLPINIDTKLGPMSAEGLEQKQAENEAKSSIKTLETLSADNVNDNYELKAEDIKAYVAYMLTNKKGNVSPGYKTIAKNTGLADETCRKIKGHLERKGIIKADGTKTIIRKDDIL